MYRYTHVGMKERTIFVVERFFNCLLFVFHGQTVFRNFGRCFVYCAGP